MIKTINIEKKLKKIISQIFNCSEKIIKNNSGPICNDIKKWDSFGNLELILTVEKEFKIRFLSQEINKINNFKMLLFYSKKAYSRKTS